MDRIDPLDSGSYVFRRSERKKAKKRISIGNRRFSLLLETMRGKGLFLDNLQEELCSNNLEELVDEVYATGDCLKDAQTLENIKRYKGAVKAFLHFVVDNMLLIEEKTSGNNILKRKRFTQIKVIDQKLDRLVRDILQNQYEQLEILQRIDEINGLLVDLLT